MVKFEFIRANNKEVGKISTAIHNVKNKLLNETHNLPQFLEKQGKKCGLSAKELLQKTITILKKENGDILPDNLVKYEE